MKVGDLVRFKWAYDKIVAGVVISVQPTPNYHSGIDFTMELLESDGRKLFRSMNWKF
jgi:hypothetical protein